MCKLFCMCLVYTVFEPVKNKTSICRADGGLCAVVCVRPGLGVFYLCYDSLESCRVVEGQVGKNLAVDFYT